MSNCSQNSQKVCTKLLSLPDNAKKLNFQSLSQNRNLHPLQSSTPNLTTSSTHTNQVKTLCMVCPGTTSIPVYKPKHTLDLKNFGCAGFQEKLRMLFPTHLQARELCAQTYSLSLPLKWSQVRHTPASIKLGGAYKPEKLAFYSTFARQVCDDTRLPGWLPALPVHS